MKGLDPGLLIHVQQLDLMERIQMRWDHILHYMHEAGTSAQIEECGPIRVRAVDKSHGLRGGASSRIGAPHVDAQALNQKES